MNVYSKKDKQMKAPNIYKYIDFRLFLKDIFMYKKKKNKFFSYRYFASKAGFVSPTFIKLVIEGKRNLTSESIPKIAKGFGLRKKEREFLENLVLMNQAKALDEKDHYYKKLSKMRGYIKVKFLEKAAYDYFHNWYNPVIREIIIFGDRKYTAAQIAAKLDPKITPQQVKQSLKILKNLGMIKQNKDGCWEREDKAVSSGSEVDYIMIANFHKSMLKLAAESIDHHKASERDISAITMSINHKTMAEIKERLIAFRREIIEMACNDKDVDQVIQLNMQAFPVTNSTERKPKK